MTFELSPQGFGWRSLAPALSGFSLVAALAAAQQVSPAPLAIALMVLLLVVAALCVRAWRRRLKASRLRLSVESGRIALSQSSAGALLGDCAINSENVHLERWSPPGRWGSAPLDSPAVRIDGPWPFELSIGACTIWAYTTGPKRGLPRYLIEVDRWKDLAAALSLHPAEASPKPIPGTYSNDRSSRRS